MKKLQGFTLIEVLVVLSIITILAMMALPSTEPAVARQQVAESLGLIEDYKKLAHYYHQQHSAFLSNNEAAAIPPPEKLLGNYVDRIELKDGAFHLHFGNKAHPAIKDKTLSVRPIAVKNSPDSPISWVCGISAVPANMEAIGENRTTIEAANLPMNCRI